LTPGTAQQLQGVVYRFRGRVIEAVSVDFWNTIAADTTYEQRRELRRNRVHDWLAGRGLAGSREETVAMMDAYSQHWHDTWKKEHRTLTAFDAADHILERCVLQDEGARDSLAQVIDSVLLDLPPEPVEGINKAIGWLATRFPLALISDTGLSGGESIDSLLAGWGLLEHFSARVYSEELGVSKPHSRMFLTAAERLNVPYHRMLHVGDLDATDIFGAKNLGMAAIRFDGAKLQADCKPCSMADLIVSRWGEVVESLER